MKSRDLQARLDKFAIVIHGFATPLLDPLKSRNAAVQMIKSSSSMAQNYASTCTARSHKEFTAKIGVVAEESEETLKWLLYVEKTGIVTPDRTESLIQEAGELTAIARASWRTAERNEGRDDRRPKRSGPALRPGRSSKKPPRPRRKHL